MESSNQLVAIYEKLSNLRSKIFLKSTTKQKIGFIFNLFGGKYGVYRIYDHPAGRIYLKDQKYIYITHKIDIATKRILIILGLYGHTSTLPSTTDSEIISFNNLIDEINLIIIKKVKLKDLEDFTTQLEKLYADNEAA